jgi:putative heme-binding domain-containing protein
MYREVIEHPWSLPDNIKKHLDLNSGNDKGRIWRIVPEPRGGTGVPPVKLSTATTAELVKLLEHSNGWHRDTAARLLFTRQDKTAIPLLEQLLTQSTSPLGRLHALYALQGLSAIKESHVLAALSHESPNLRIHAIRLAETLPQLSPELKSHLSSFARDPDATVRYQLALSTQTLPLDRLSVLSAIARGDHASQWIRAAVTAAAGDQTSQLLQQLLSDAEIAGTSTGRDLLRSLAAALPPNAVADVAKTLTPTVEKLPDESARYAIAAALIDSAGASRESVVLALKSIKSAARVCAPDKSKPEPTRLAAIDLLARLADPKDTDLLAALVVPTQTSSLQAAAIAALDRIPGVDLPKLLLPRWPQMSPRVREAVLAALIKRNDRAAALLGAIEAGQIKPAEFPAAQVAAFKQSRDKNIRERTNQLFSATSTRREDVFQEFTPALDLKGDAIKGHDLYLARCASCHRLGNEGHALGPDLATVKNMGKEKLLTNILDPNREVAANFTAYVVESTDGDQQIGLIASETPATVTLKMAYAQEITLPRAEIKSLRSANLSMMPEGLEQDLTPQQLADLLEFIMR